MNGISTLFLKRKNRLKERIIGWIEEYRIRNLEKKLSDKELDLLVNDIDKGLLDSLIENAVKDILVGIFIFWPLAIVLLSIITIRVPIVGALMIAYELSPFGGLAVLMQVTYLYIKHIFPTVYRGYNKNGKRLTYKVLILPLLGIADITWIPVTLFVNVLSYNILAEVIEWYLLHSVKSRISRIFSKFKFI